MNYVGYLVYLFIPENREIFFFFFNSDIFLLHNPVGIRFNTHIYKSDIITFKF